MKKLMIAAFMAAFGVATYGATATWGTSGYVYAIPAATLAAGLTDGANYTAESLKVTGADFTGTYGGTLAYVLTITDADGNSKAFENSLAKGSGLSSAGKVSGVDISDALIVAGKDYTYNLVFTAKVKDGNGKEFTLTSNAIADAWHANDQGDIGLMTAGPSSWTAAAAVPEPTSGLMLVIGLGVMALRRRRA